MNTQGLESLSTGMSLSVKHVLSFCQFPRYKLNWSFWVSIETLRVPAVDVCATAVAILLEVGIILENTENATEDFIVRAPFGEEAYTSPPPGGVKSRETKNSFEPLYALVGVLLLTA
jgi:hypothetical protein